MHPNVAPNFILTHPKHTVSWKQTKVISKMAKKRSKKSQLKHRSNAAHAQFCAFKNAPSIQNEMSQSSDDHFHRCQFQSAAIDYYSTFQ